jgi:hypothetical protein
MKSDNIIKDEEQDRIRCANYLLDMIVKYGAEAKAEENIEKSSSS